MRNFGARLFALVFGLVFSSLVMATGSGTAKIRFCTPTQVTADCKMTKGALDLYDAIQWDCRLKKSGNVVNQNTTFQQIADDEPFSQTIPVQTGFQYERNYCARNESQFRNDGNLVLQINTGDDCKFSGTDPNNPPN